MSRLVNLSALVFSLTAFFLTIWIIVPAPQYYFWLLAVAVSEWSLWLGLAALIGIICALLSRFLFDGKLWIVSLICGVCAFGISLYPFFSALSAAEKQSTSLSFKQYFLGGKLNQQSSNSSGFSTFTFARTRAELNAICKALDRVLRAGYYWVPMWNNPDHWLAYWDQFSRPAQPPKFDPGVLTTWWFDDAKAARVKIGG